MKANISFRTRNERADVPAVVDSGATENFIHYKFARKYRLPLAELATARPVRNVDGTLNRLGRITHAIRLNVQYCSQPTPFLFYMTDLGEDDLILGFPFLFAINPMIDWTQGKLYGLVVIFTDNSDEYLKEKTSLRGNPKDPNIGLYRPPTRASTMSHAYYPSKDKPHSSKRKRTAGDSGPRQTTRPKKSRILRELAGTWNEEEGTRLVEDVQPLYAKCAHILMDTGYNRPPSDPTTYKYWRILMNLPPEEPEPLSIRRTTLSTQLAIQANTKPELPWTEIVPQPYHRFKRVFSEEECERFPPSRSWDHTIELTPDAPSSFNCRVYPQPPALREATDEFLLKNLRKKYIQ